MSERDHVINDNVYAALGFAEPEGMHVKARLAMQISDLVKAKGLSQTQAAKLVKMPQPKLSGMLRGKFRGVSEAKMMQCLAELGTDVYIVIRASPAGAAVGRVDVVVQKSAERLMHIKWINVDDKT